MTFDLTWLHRKWHIQSWRVRVKDTQASFIRQYLFIRYLLVQYLHDSFLISFNLYQGDDAINRYIINTYVNKSTNKYIQYIMNPLINLSSYQLINTPINKPTIRSTRRWILCKICYCLNHLKMESLRKYLLQWENTCMVTIVCMRVHVLYALYTIKSSVQTL